jgi:hypothetical protein
MWIKNLYGDTLVNLNNTAYVGFGSLSVGESSHSVYVIMNDKDRHILFAGAKDQCQKYMAELEKELAAFGKLVRVEVD